MLEWPPTFEISFKTRQEEQASVVLQFPMPKVYSAGKDILIMLKLQRVFLQRVQIYYYLAVAERWVNWERCELSLNPSVLTEVDSDWQPVDYGVEPGGVFVQ